MKYFLAILLLLQMNTAFAQGDSSEEEKKSTYDKIRENINPLRVVGVWQNLELPDREIKFVLVGPSLQIGEGQFASYHFHNYEQGFVSRLGVLSRWPPEYCYILSVTADTLGLEFFGAMDNQSIVRKNTRKKE